MKHNWGVHVEIEKPKHIGYGPEYILCRQISNYLKWQYPKALFHFDLTGLGLTKAQAGMNKAIQHGTAWLDLFIAEARHGHHGMFLEIKPEDTRIKKRDGTYASDHLSNQGNMIQLLEARGFYASFSVGFDQSKQFIDWYLNENRPDLLKIK